MSFNLHLNPGNLAKFYREFYDLQEMEKPADDPSHYLTDGRMTMIISPWSITDFEGAGIEPRHMDHLGFRVEDVDSFKKDLQELVKRNPALAPKPGGHPIRYHRNLTACTHGAAGEPQGVTALVREGNAKCFHFAAQFRIFANSHARFKERFRRIRGQVDLNPIPLLHTQHPFVSLTEGSLEKTKSSGLEHLRRPF